MSVAIQLPVSVAPMNLSLSVAPLAGRAASQCSDCVRARMLCARDLESRMRHGSPFLLLDCRSFIAYNLCHINGALNISCADRFTRRRLAGGRTRVGDLVSGQDTAKDLYQELWEADFVIYDDCTTSIASLPASHPIQTVLEALRKEGKEPYVLKGGLKAFQCQFSDLCVQPNPEKTPPRLVSPTTPVIHNKIETTSATEVLPFLFLGNERDARNGVMLRSLGITHVLNVTSHVEHHYQGQGIHYKRLPATDSCHQNLAQYFAEAFEFIDNARVAGGKVLVHCQAGVSRSATVVVAYVMKKSAMVMSDAYRYVKTKRDIIAPNFNFMGQLMEFDQALGSGQVPRDLDLLPLLTC